MDPLSQTIALLKPRALLWKSMEAGGDWAVRFPANRSVVFCLITAGACRVQIADQAAQPLERGDFLLLAKPPVWTLSGGAAAPVIDFDPARLRPAMRIGDREGPAEVSLLGGRFTFDPANTALLAGFAPAVVKVEGADPTAGRLRTVLDLMGDEAVSNRPGHSLVLERLMEIVLVETIRHAADGAGAGRRGLLAGLADRQVAMAVNAIHADVRRRWTVADLATIAGMSRSVFAERFGRVMGLAPIDYLLHWRMALARDALRSGAGRVAQVAEAAGYQSVSAFSTAFRRSVGCSPARWAAGDQY